MILAILRRPFTVGLLSVLLPAAAALAMFGNAAHGAPAAAAAVTIRAHVVVDGGAVHLEDVFEGAGTGPGRVIARAPRPGQRTTLDARFLWRVARVHGLNWRPLSRHDSVTVERASTVVSTVQIKARLHQALESRIAADAEMDLELELDQPDLTVHLPVDADTRLRVSRLDYEPRSGRFDAVLIGADGIDSQRIAVSGKVFRIAEAPVPARRLGVGHIIRERDLQWITVRAAALDRNVLTDEQLIVGQAARRPLSEGRPIRAGDIEPPLLVRRKAMVTIILETPSMTLTAQGRALEDGALGDTVRVENTQSRRTIEATVDGPNLVRVTGAHRIALR